MKRGAVAEIDLSAISSNFRIVKALTQNRPVIAVVKADAYGHGAVEVSRRLVRDGAEYLAVAFTEEATDLRDAGINIPIIVLFDRDIKDIFNYSLTPVISDIKTAEALSKEVENRNSSISVHIKVDTGMGRLGLTGNAVREILEIANIRGVTVEGVMSHFSDAESSDPSFAMVQIERFNALRQELLNNGLKARLFHMANSAAVIALPQSHFDAVRPGLMLYGYSPIQVSSVKCQVSDLQPVMTVKTKILALRRLKSGAPVSYGRTFITERDSLIGVIPIGYADNFSRRFSNNSAVIVRGKRVPVVGRVCMDLTMIDLTEVKAVLENDEVIIMGRQGNESIDAGELASRTDTISYDILTSLGSRATKVYIN